MSELSIAKPVRFVLENDSSSGIEPRPRGRKSLDSQVDGDRKSRNRRNQRAYRQRQQLQLLAAEKERDQYKDNVTQLQQRLLDKNVKLERMANLVYDMERLCLLQGIIVPTSIRERLQVFKDRAAQDVDDQFADINESLRTIPEPLYESSRSDSSIITNTTPLYGTPLSDPSIITNTTPSPHTVIESPPTIHDEPSPALNLTLPLDPDGMDLDGLVTFPGVESIPSPSNELPLSSPNELDTLRGPIPKHVALYYIQSQYLQKIAHPEKPQRPSGLDPTPLELALSEKIRLHPRLKFMPCPKLRGRLLLFQDILDINTVIDHTVKGSICWGRDPTLSDSWELPEVLFYDYWFICDEDMLRNTNRWRQLSGRAPIVWDSAGRHVKKDSGPLAKHQTKFIGLPEEDSIQNGHPLQL
ncbi:hypothetical protein Unana1_05311 [Umbelopsis nana]